MAISKLQFVQSKKIAITKQQRRNMAELLKQEKEQSCRIRVENIIREDVYIELLEYLELYCELLLARIGLLDSYASTVVSNLHDKNRDSKEIKDIADSNGAHKDSGLEEALKVIIYSANHTEIKELNNLKEIFLHKFGLDFAKSAIENRNDCIPEKIVKRTLNESPPPELVSLYLKEIAKAYNVPFSELTDDEEEEQPEEEEEDVEEEQEADVEKKNSAQKDKPKRKVLEPKYKEKRAPKTVPKQKKTVKEVEEDEVDLLKKRFAALKKIPK